MAESTNGRKPTTQDTWLPEEFELKEEVRWLKSEDKDLFQNLQASMNKIQPGYIATYPPTECGIATFTRDVVTSVAKYTPFSRPWVVAMTREDEIEAYDRAVRFRVVKDNRKAYVEAANAINESPVDLLNVQHEFGIYGGPDGEYLLDLLNALRKPSIATLHTVLERPSVNQKRIVQEMGKRCEALIVMVKTGRRILLDTYGLDPRKVTVIPHGVPNVHRMSSDRVKRSLGLGDYRVISTFGLISRGKGIEHAIRAMPAILKEFPNTVYLVLGETHPGVRKEEGESYRNMLLGLVDELDLHEHVRFNNRFLMLSELVRYLCATDVYVTPYLSKDQITSGTLAYALGCGKAIISTPYLYAQEVLSQGRGLLVDVGSHDEIAEAAKRILGDAVLKEGLENAAYQYGRRAAWFNVAVDYLDVFRRVVTHTQGERPTTT